MSDTTDRDKLAELRRAVDCLLNAKKIGGQHAYSLVRLRTMAHEWGPDGYDQPDNLEQLLRDSLTLVAP